MIEREAPDCPPRDALVAWFEAPRPGSAIEAHLASGCPACARLLEVLDELRRYAADDGVEVPEAWSERARAIGRAEAPGTPRVHERRATLALDSAATDTLVPVRGSSTRERQFVYAADGVELQLVWTASGSLLGQVESDDPDRTPDLGVGALWDGRTARDFPIGADGDFALEGVVPGRYELLLEGGSERVVVGGVELSIEPGA